MAGLDSDHSPGDLDHIENHEEIDTRLVAVETSVASKASTTALTNGLNAKADADDVADALALKADASAVSDKATVTQLNNAINALTPVLIKTQAQYNALTPAAGTVYVISD